MICQSNNNSHMFSASGYSPCNARGGLRRCLTDTEVFHRLLGVSWNLTIRVSALTAPETTLSSWSRLEERLFGKENKRSNISCKYRHWNKKHEINCSICIFLNRDRVHPKYYLCYASNRLESRAFTRYNRLVPWTASNIFRTLDSARLVWTLCKNQ